MQMLRRTPRSPVASSGIPPVGRCPPPPIFFCPKDVLSVHRGREGLILAPRHRRGGSCFQFFSFWMLNIADIWFDIPNQCCLKCLVFPPPNSKYHQSRCGSCSPIRCSWPYRCSLRNIRIFKFFYLFTAAPQIHHSLDEGPRAAWHVSV